MIKFLIYAAIVLVFLFVLTLVGSAMLWVILKLLRSLFPQKFQPHGKRKEDKVGMFSMLLSVYSLLCALVSLFSSSAFGSASLLPWIKRKRKDVAILVQIAKTGLAIIFCVRLSNSIRKMKIPGTGPGNEYYLILSNSLQNRSAAA